MQELSPVTPEQSDIARQSQLLVNFPDAIADAALKRSIVKHFRHGEVIFSHGDPAHSVHIVLDGWVKLYRVAPSGTEAVVGVFTRGRSFGEAVALQGGAYPVTGEAATDCTLVVVRAAELTSIMNSNPEICIAVLASTFAHLQSLVGQLEQLKAHTGAQRVAEFLVQLAPVAEGPCLVTLPFDKILIAGRLGMKPESLSRAFVRLREIGVTIRQTRAEIADIHALRLYAAGEESRPDEDGSRAAM